jgi:SpoVK/Ycf46/Vps4 family AAA+-type ATPase
MNSTTALHHTGASTAVPAQGLTELADLLSQMMALNPPQPTQPPARQDTMEAADRRSAVESMIVMPGRVKLSDMTLESHIRTRLTMDLLLPLQHPKLFRGAQAAEKGVLLYGPPGCGKTMLVGPETDASCFRPFNSLLL